ncbi:hypothetical protein DFJ77DRAFT_480683 [Powellomyces hirtus]|nr:hypothetical protein DFJ77DRAFT_480683 [Powellomyces hirtus]
MQDVERDLRRIIHGMVTTDLALARRTLDTYYTDDVVLVHPYLVANGKEEMFEVFQMWTGSQTILTPEIFNTTYNEETKTGIVEFAQNFYPKALGGIVPLKVRLMSVVKWRETPEGLKIYHHRDIHIPTSFIEYTPLLGPFYDTTYRRIAHKVLTKSYQIADRVGIWSIAPALVSTAATALSYVGIKLSLPAPRTSVMEQIEQAQHLAEPVPAKPEPAPARVLRVTPSTA